MVVLAIDGGAIGKRVGASRGKLLAALGALEVVEEESKGMVLTWFSTRVAIYRRGSAFR